jgi:hypothetical protein
MTLGTRPLEAADILVLMKIMAVLCPRLHQGPLCNPSQAAECKGAWGAAAGR